MRIGIDIDGVLADFNTYFMDYYANLTGVDRFPRRPFDIPTWHYPQLYGYSEDQDKTVWDAIAADPNFWRSLPTYPTTFQDLVYLILREQHQGDDLYFVTSRPGATAKAQTEQWFRKVGPVARFNPTVLISSQKGMVAQALKLDVYVDDRWENCLDVKTRSNASTFLLARPWNTLQYRAYTLAGSPEGPIWETDQVSGVMERVEETRRAGRRAA